MKTKSIILASASPRRKELLSELQLPFEVIPACTEEVFDVRVSIPKAIEKIAYKKAEEVFLQHPTAIVIGCDTMVCLDDVVLGKPRNQEDAYRMLRLLSGKTHQVISGVAILQEGHTEVFHQVTEVTFYELDEAMIDMYVRSEEPYDKAGAYGIQGLGKLLVSAIHGDYFNVVGFPIAKVYRVLKEQLSIS